MPGFKLARLCAELYPKHSHASTIGLVLMNHGLFTFGDTAKIAYERMIELVTLAEDYLAKKGAWNVSASKTNSGSELGLGSARGGEQRIAIATLRREVSGAMGSAAIVSVHRDPAALAFVRRSDLASISQQGPATPDHVIRTKRLPMVGRDLGTFRTAYTEYFKTHAAKASQSLTMLDPAPRVILDPELGVCTVGRTAKEAAIASDVYHHTMEIIQHATALGGWSALPAQDIFDVEYWDLEQAKLRAAGKPAMFAGEVAVVTGAASGIGKACVEALLKRGAAVVGLDVNPAITDLFRRPDFHGVVCDLTKDDRIVAALEEGVAAFGGLDLLVLNAGIFPPGAPIAELPGELWRKVMSVNLDATFLLMREAHPLLKLAPNGGRVVVIGSKNVPAPGPGAAAYSASKAAVNQLARVAALEWGKDRIRINSLHPNMVFDTALWTPEILASRAKHYGLTVEQYKTNNVLKTEVSSRDVAELAAEMCGPLFAKTTAAQVPVDGGNDRVI
jgi:NAD(P)-dependent dehydrogenase (short-subunit alcohol dehydrogenase family)/ribulose-5-phosphate 4-epimerase/fuculose-1-phosphate aldolase